MLDEDDPPGKACNIALIPQSEKDAVLSDCDSDGSDMGYEGQRAHLPARLLKANASEIMSLCTSLSVDQYMSLLGRVLYPLVWRIP